MPLFFLISGYLHKDLNTINLIKKLAKKLLIPLCLFLVLGYLYLVLSSLSLRSDIIIRSFKSIIIGRNISANPMLWFLLALFWVRILSNIIIKKPKVFVGVFIFFFILINTFRINFFFVGTALMALPFYLFGHYNKDIINTVITHRKKILFFALFFVSTIFISSINGKVSMMGIKYGNTPYFIVNLILFYINGIVGTMMILCLSYSFSKESRIVKLSAYCSLSIVGLQIIPIRIWLRHIGYNASFPLTFIYSIFIMVICTVFHLITEKYAKCLLGSNK